MGNNSSQPPPPPLSFPLPGDLETGDLVLFKTKSHTACLTRCATDSPWDHVALVLRTAEGLRTVECTGGGIGCWILQERVDDRIITAACVRRLETRLVNAQVDALNQFLQSIKHKPYRLSASIYSRLAVCGEENREEENSWPPAEENIESPQNAVKITDISLKSPRSRRRLSNPDLSRSPRALRTSDIDSLHNRRGFFCSSFLAACYMKMGLLPPSPGIDWYLPHSFSEDSTVAIPFIGAQLGEEILIKPLDKEIRENRQFKPRNKWPEEEQKEEIIIEETLEFRTIARRSSDAKMPSEIPEEAENRGLLAASNNQTNQKKHTQTANSSDYSSSDALLDALRRSSDPDGLRTAEPSDGLLEERRLIDAPGQFDTNSAQISVRDSSRLVRDGDEETVVNESAIVFVCDSDPPSQVRRVAHSREHSNFPQGRHSITLHSSLARSSDVAHDDPESAQGAETSDNFFDRSKILQGSSFLRQAQGSALNSEEPSLNERAPAHAEHDGHGDFEPRHRGLQSIEASISIRHESPGSENRRIARGPASASAQHSLVHSPLHSQEPSSPRDSVADGISVSAEGDGEDFSSVSPVARQLSSSNLDVCKHYNHQISIKFTRTRAEQARQREAFLRREKERERERERKNDHEHEKEPSKTRTIGSNTFVTSHRYQYYSKYPYQLSVNSQENKEIGEFSSISQSRVLSYSQSHDFSQLGLPISTGAGEEKDSRASPSPGIGRILHSGSTGDSEKVSHPTSAPIEAASASSAQPENEWENSPSLSRDGDEESVRAQNSIRSSPTPMENATEAEHSR